MIDIVLWGHSLYELLTDVVRDGVKIDEIIIHKSYWNRFGHQKIEINLEIVPFPGVVMDSLRVNNYWEYDGVYNTVLLIAKIITKNINVRDVGTVECCIICGNVMIQGVSYLERLCRECSSITKKQAEHKYWRMVSDENRRKNQTKTGECWIYFMKEVNSNITKVGISYYPKQRMVGIQSANKLEIIKKIKYVKREQAIEKEKKLHDKYKKYKTNGEWFDLPEEEINIIRRINVTPHT